MTSDLRAAPVTELEALIHEQIPLARAMGLVVTGYSERELAVTAPLEPNVNDKGCAFGGSLASLLLLTGWGLVGFGLHTRGFVCDVYVGEAQLRYHEPVWGVLRGVARFDAGGSLDRLVASLRARGKGHAAVVCEIAGAGRPAVTLSGRFFARFRQ